MHAKTFAAILVEVGAIDSAQFLKACAKIDEIESKLLARDKARERRLDDLYDEAMRDQ